MDERLKVIIPVVVIVLCVSSFLIGVTVSPSWFENDMENENEDKKGEPPATISLLPNTYMTSTHNMKSVKDTQSLAVSVNVTDGPPVDFFIMIRKMYANYTAGKPFNYFPCLRKIQHSLSLQSLVR